MPINVFWECMLHTLQTSMLIEDKDSILKYLRRIFRFSILKGGAKTTTFIITCNGIYFSSQEQIAYTFSLRKLFTSSFVQISQSVRFSPAMKFSQGMLSESVKDISWVIQTNDRIWKVVLFGHSLTLVHPLCVIIASNQIMIAWHTLWQLSYYLM